MGQKKSLKGWPGRFRSPSYWIATGFGSGLMPFAPGTFGSLAAFPFALSIISLSKAVDSCATPIIVSITAISVIFALFVLGVFAVNSIERTTNVHDAPEIVIDEIVGQLIAWFPIYLAVGCAPFDDAFHWLPYFIGFVLFRVFDIIKPWPIGLLDRRVEGGFGVMIDDVVAGFMALGFTLLYFSFVNHTSPYFS